VRQRPAYHNGFLSIGPKARLMTGELMRPLVGRANFGAELSGGYRFLGPVRGLTLSGGVGYAPHTARFVDGSDVRYEWRHVAWGWAGVGYRLALRHGDLGAGYRLRLSGVTALDDDSCLGHAACDEWLWLTQGLALEQSVSLGRRASLYIEEEVGITALDVDGTGVKPTLDLGLRIGIEVGL